jgi:hypothetical protein
MHHHAWLISSFELQVSTYMKYSYWVSSSLWSLPASTFYARKDKTLILKMNTYFSHIVVIVIHIPLGRIKPSSFNVIPCSDSRIQCKVGLIT